MGIILDAEEFPGIFGESEWRQNVPEKPKLVRYLRLGSFGEGVRYQMERLANWSWIIFHPLRGDLCGISSAFLGLSA